MLLLLRYCCLGLIVVVICKYRVRSFGEISAEKTSSGIAGTKRESSRLKSQPIRFTCKYSDTETCKDFNWDRRSRENCWSTRWRENSSRDDKHAKVNWLMSGAKHIWLLLLPILVAVWLLSLLRYWFGCCYCCHLVAVAEVLLFRFSCRCHLIVIGWSKNCCCCWIQESNQLVFCCCSYLLLLLLLLL